MRTFAPTESPSWCQPAAEHTERNQIQNDLASGHIMYDGLIVLKERSILQEINFNWDRPFYFSCPFPFGVCPAGRYLYKHATLSKLDVDPTEI